MKDGVGTWEALLAGFVTLSGTGGNGPCDWAAGSRRGHSSREAG